MKSLAKRLLAILALGASAALAPAAALADTLTEAEIRLAANNFVSSDAIGSSVLAGRAVASVTAHDSLWVVRLSPSGYVVLSGESTAEPVIAFSRNDYVEPADDSPFGALLSIANGNAQIARTKDVVAANAASSPLCVASAAYATALTAAVPAAETATSARRASKWSALLATSTGAASTTDSTSKSDVVYPSYLWQDGFISTLLTTIWSQWQPYNDFVPVDPTVDAATVANNAYRGRYASGCISTTYAQLMNYWQWPVRFDDIVTCDHSVLNSEDGETTCRLRFDGRAPFDWSGLVNEYEASAKSSADLRGTVKESVRFPVARLFFFADVLSQMSFATSGSGANILTPAKANPWYETGEYLQRKGANHAGTYVTDESVLLTRIREEIQNGVPVPLDVTLSGGGHSVIAHGWKTENGTDFAYCNYGWGGQSDGYFTMNGSASGETAYVGGALVGHAPRCKAQIDSLPAVSGDAWTLTWRMPPKFPSTTPGISSFRIVQRTFDTTNSVWTQDFSSFVVPSTVTTNIFVGTTSYMDGNGLIVFSPIDEGEGNTLDLMDDRILTGTSKLTYRARAYYGLNLDVRIQARFDGGDWEDLATIDVGTGTELVDWTTKTISLGDRAGQVMRLRLSAKTMVGNYYPICDVTNPCGIQLDDFQITDVKGYSTTSFEPTLEQCATTTNNVFCVPFIADDFVHGGRYSFLVTPLGTDFEGEESEPAWTRISADGAAPALPEITSVTSMSDSAPAQVQEGFFRECARGTNVFFVSCSANVTKLQAFPGNLTLVPDEKVAVYPQGDGKFVVTIDGSGIGNGQDRTRMILTLAAMDANGTTSVKDLSLRFSSETAAETYAAGGGDSGETGGDDETKVTATLIPVPHSWLVEKGLVAEGATDEAFEEAAKDDYDGDGQPAYAEYLCGTDPKDKDDVFKIFIEMADGEPQITWSPTNATARYVVIGVTNLVDETWVETNAVNRAGLRFFRVRVEPAR